MQAVPIPTPGTSSVLRGVTRIPGTSTMWTVGSYQAKGRTLTLVEYWNGRSARVIPSPNMGSNPNNLNAVSATSATDAWAVGTEEDTTIGTQLLILHWDGTSWNFASAPHPTGTSTLMSVSALNTHLVFAVGVKTNGPVTSTALIEQWNGTHWSLDTTSQPPISGLNGVAIGSSSSVLAVGRVRTNAGTNETLTEFFNGSFWQSVPSPNRGTSSNSLDSVDFVNTNEAWAVGKTTTSNAQNNVLVLHWNGSGWHVVSAPNKGVASQFNAIAVDHRSGVAWGVGSYKPTTNTLQTLVERSC